MKKIIYALVIMIAAGSLFTSCIEPVEPDGILALREAKARYYDALSKLREADGEYRRAEAALKQAEAALKQAEAAHQQAVTDAYTKMQALLREAKELENASAELDLELKAAEVAQKIDKIQKQMELAEKQHEIDLVNMQNNLAQAQEALRLALRKIELAAQDLTKEEKDCLIAAATAYYEIYKKINEQQLKVMKAENKLAKAEREAEMAKYNQYDPATGKVTGTGEYVWDKESASYQNFLDYYNGKIEKYEAFIAEDEDILENVPAIDDLEAWGEEIAGYKQAAKELEYSKYTLTQDAAAYYVANVHDGIKTFNDAIVAWKEDHKAVADPGAEPAEPQQSSYKTNTTKDSLAIAPLVAVPESEDGFIIYKRFADLVGELDDLQKPTGKFKDTLGKIAKVEKKDGKYQATISATFGIKDLVFGKEDNWKAGKSTELKYQAGDTVKVDVNGAVKYGVDGAISVLRRELVLAKEALDVKALEDAYNDAKDTWEADRKVLEAGLAEYQPYKDAVKEMKKQDSLNKANGGTMVSAIKNLLEQVASVNEANLSKNDSVQIMKAFKEFAAAREKYLKYYHDNRPGKGTKNVTPDVTNENKLFFHFAKASDGLDVINDSILFSELSYEALKKGKWNFPVDKDPTVASNSYENPEPNAALGNIAAQLLGDDWGKALAKDPVSGIGWTLPTTLTKDAFYGEYEYVAGDPGKMRRLAIAGADAPLDAVEDPYDPGMDAAKKAVNDAIQEYMDIYNAYWHGADYATECGALNETSDEKAIKAARDKEIKVGIYKEETFSEPYQIVSFLSDGNIIYNDGLGTILAFIDPKVTFANAWDANDNGNLKENTILGKKGDLTTFGEYLKAKQAYETHGAIEAYEEAIKAIEEWAKTAKAVFTTAEEGNNKDDVAKYTAEHSAWETKHQTWKTNTEKYGKYMDNLKAFVGVDDDDEPLVADPATHKIPETYQAGVDQIFTIDPLTYGFPLVDTKAWDWIETLGGELKTLAESCFPDFPTEMKGWKDEADRINDEIAHNDILVAALDPVYTASVKVINHDEYPTWKRDQTNGEITETNTPLAGSDILGLVESYKIAREKYIDDVNKDIDHWKDEIANAKKLIADYEGGADPYVIAVEEAKLELQLAKKELTVLNELLKGAKENLDRIIEYLLSQDVNFINLSGYTSTITTTLK